MPGTEAHGGYTFCSVAGLSILESLRDADLDALEVGLERVCERRSGCMIGRRAWKEGTTGGRTNWWTDAIRGMWGPRSRMWPRRGARRSGRIARG